MCKTYVEYINEWGASLMTQRSRGRRQGEVFSMRIEPAVRAELERLCAADSGPKRLGPWLVWRARSRAPGQALPELTALDPLAAALAASITDACFPDDAGAGNTASMRRRGNTAAIAGDTKPREPGCQCHLEEGDSPCPVHDAFSPADRVILDLCAGSGAWSEPYQRAGYAVRRVTLPADDVRTFIPPARVWGILAAPPCTEFSLAKNGRERDFVRGLETVAACHRIILTARPRWWALENPVGLLSRFLGRPAFVFQPHDFGDPWTKRTAIWGEFNAPTPGPYVRPISGGGPICERCSPDAPGPCSVADHRAITPPGFARAFFEANP